jgi:hypothetical protein
MPARKPPLTVAQILSWADSHLARTGQWPSCTDQDIRGAPGETWVNVNQALAKGLRGLPGGDTLPRLLDRERGRRQAGDLPRLTEGQIAAWAEAHRARTGRWPDASSGPVEGAPGEAWSAVCAALRKGLRGLPRGSLPRLLARRFGARNRTSLPRLTEGQILRWADAHRRRTGRWPQADSGAVAGEPGQTWQGVNKALVRGLRGLPGGSSLARLLEARRGKGNKARTPPLTEGLILRWADAHRARTGRWPTQGSGLVTAAPAESWSAVNQALHSGLRGLPGGASLPRLLRRSGREGRERPRLDQAPVRSLPPAPAAQGRLRRLQLQGLRRRRDRLDRRPHPPGRGACRWARRAALRFWSMRTWPARSGTSRPPQARPKFRGCRRKTCPVAPALTIRGWADEARRASGTGFTRFRPWEREINPRGLKCGDRAVRRVGVTQSPTGRGLTIEVRR